MFEAWETFYLLVGTSAAALVGVMFIVITLAADIEVEQVNRGTTIYQTPTVFHLGAIVGISALVSMPDHLLSAMAVVIIIVSVLGIAYSALTTQRMFETYEFYRATVPDRFFFGVLPGAFYLLFGIGGIATWLMPGIAAEAVGTAILLLLLVSIRNAWDVATFTVRISRTLAIKDRQTK